MLREVKSCDVQIKQNIANLYLNHGYTVVSFSMYMLLSGVLGPPDTDELHNHIIFLTPLHH